MKRILAAVIVLAASFQAMAQDVTYALPFTSFTVEVDLVQEIHFAGPYAAFAKKMLDLDVPESDVRNTYIKEIRVIPHVEADPWTPRFVAPAGNSTMLQLSSQGLISFGDVPQTSGMEWRFNSLAKADNGIATSSGISYKAMHAQGVDLRFPVDYSFTAAKTLEDKAAAAAEMILNARQDRRNIAIGNTDANYSGESMGAALAELTKIEDECLILFTGYDAVTETSAVFEVLPSPTARVHKYTAFYMTEDGRLLKETKGRAKPYELELTPVAVPDVKAETTPDAAKPKKQEKAVSIHYRIPAICKMRLLEDGTPLLESRVPVYQLGRETEMPINQ